MTVETLPTGLTDMVFVTAPAGDFDRLFIVRQSGRIRTFDLHTNTLNPGAFLNISSSVISGVFDERGLLGLAFHPNYTANRKFYVYFSAAKQADIPANWDHETRVMEFTTLAGNPELADAASGRMILRFGQPHQDHNGGWIGFGPDGYLYIATGDGGHSFDTGTGHTEPGGNAQDITGNLLGKMLRIDVNGDDFPSDANRNYAIPPTNPFVGVAGDDEIWCYGLRNPWRSGFDRLTGDLYIADVGQNAFEEIDFQPAGSPGGENYGWRCTEGPECTGYDGCTCDAPELTEPIYYYHRSEGCAIIGGYPYRGSELCAAAAGLYFFADLCTGDVWTLRVVNGVATDLAVRTAELDPPGSDVLNGIVSFGEDARGELYIVSQAGGNLYRLARPCPRIDIDGDCDVDATDLALFTGVLLDNDSDPTHRNHSDLNCDQTCDGDDIGLFVDSYVPDCPDLDVNGDCALTAADLAAFVDVLLGLNTQPAAVQASDRNGDGQADANDIQPFVSAWF